MADTLTWVVLALVIIAWILIFIIYIVYFTERSVVLQEGLTFNVVQGSTSMATETMSAGNYNLYIINSTQPSYTLTVNAASSPKTGQEFLIYNNGTNSASIKGGNGTTGITGTLAPSKLAWYVSTNSSNTYQRIL